MFNRADEDAGERRRRVTGSLNEQVVDFWGELCIVHVGGLVDVATITINTDLF